MALYIVANAKVDVYTIYEFACIDVTVTFGPKSWPWFWWACSRVQPLFLHIRRYLRGRKSKSHINYCYRFFVKPIWWNLVHYSCTRGDIVSNLRTSIDKCLHQGFLELKRQLHLFYLIIYCIVFKNRCYQDDAIQANRQDVILTRMRTICFFQTTRIGGQLWNSWTYIRVIQLVLVTRVRYIAIDLLTYVFNDYKINIEHIIKV